MIKKEIKKRGEIKDLTTAVALALVISMSFVLLIQFSGVEFGQITGLYSIMDNSTWGENWTCPCGDGYGVRKDFGDAPDSTNHYDQSMTAYPAGGPPGIVAHYPTVFDPATVSEPERPQGPCHARNRVWLGSSISIEEDADLFPDEDNWTNLNVTMDWANMDRYDDGLVKPINLTHCTNSTFNFTVTVNDVISASEGNYLLNAWFDWDRDGDWNDTFNCNGSNTSEWAVQNQLLNLTGGAATLMFESDGFLPYEPKEDEIWFRLTLSPQPGLIENCIDLQNMKDDLDGNYVIVNNINCTYDTQNPAGALYNGGQGF